MREESFIQLLDLHQSFNDDCGLIPGRPDKTVALITTDSLSENTHFRRDWSSAADIAHKLVHCNVSDCIASGAKPHWCTLNAGIPQSISDSFLRDFASELIQQLKSMQIELIGGDTYKSGLLNLTLTLGGYAKKRIGRTSVPGNFVCVTGSLGSSLEGYRHLKSADKQTKELSPRAQYAVRKHLRPSSRTDLADYFYNQDHITGAIDISDGLIADADRFVNASGFGMEICLDQIPCNGMPQDAIQSGEEYEILYTTGDLSKVKGRVIGRVTEKKELVFLESENGKPVKVKGGFSHFPVREDRQSSGLHSQQ